MVEEIVWLDEAKIEFDKVINYLTENWTEQEVAGFIRATNKVINYLYEHPRIFRKTSRRNVHEALITPQNLMLYKVIGKKIEIMTFWDTRRNPKKKKY